MRLFLALLCLSALTIVTLSGCRSAPVAPPFDVPALLGLPIDQITRQLGQPASSPNANPRAWTRDGTTLTATFRPGNGRVTELTLTGQETVRDGEQQQLLQIGQLQASDARYNVDWLEAPDRPLYYNGVRVTPAPRNYKVQLRVSGATEMLQVSYAMSGATPPAETFLTVAPWDITATLPDDATIQLSARLAQNGTLAQTPIVAEILVDGKVVASKKASVVATCDYEL